MWTHKMLYIIKTNKQLSVVMKALPNSTNEMNFRSSHLYLLAILSIKTAPFFGLNQELLSYGRKNPVTRLTESMENTFSPLSVFLVTLFIHSWLNPIQFPDIYSKTYSIYSSPWNHPLASLILIKWCCHLFHSD